MAYKDPEKRRDCQKRWAQNNPEKRRASLKASTAKYRDKIRESARRRRRRVRDRAKRRVYEKKYRAEHRERLRAAGRRRRDKSGARAVYAPCEICNLVSGLHRDHDHLTGEKRGLICTQCNAALGMVRDTRARITALITYLDRYDSGF